MKDKIVISLGGSVITSYHKGDKFLLKFRDLMHKISKKKDILIVCGGGSIARTYEEILKDEGKHQKEQSLAGIRATRAHAELIMQMFG